MVLKYLPDIAWRSQTVTLWWRNSVSCYPASVGLEKTLPASLPLVQVLLLALGGFCIQKWMTHTSTCLIRSSVDVVGSPRRVDGSAATWEPCEPLMHVFREKVRWCNNLVSVNFLHNSKLSWPLQLFMFDLTLLSGWSHHRGLQGAALGKAWGRVWHW